jgi:hypothetical protein
MSNSISAWKNRPWTGAGQPKFDVYRKTFVKQYLPHVHLHDFFEQHGNARSNALSSMLMMTGQ